MEKCDDDDDDDDENNAVTRGVRRRPKRRGSEPSERALNQLNKDPWFRATDSHWDTQTHTQRQNNIFYWLTGNDWELEKKRKEKKPGERMADGVEDGQQGVRGECGKRGCPKRLKRRGTGPSERALNPTSKLRYADKNSSARQITVLIRISTSNCTRKSEWKRETGWKEIHKSTWRLRLTWTWLNPPINEYQNGKITTVEYSINRRKERDVPHFNPLRMNPFQINNLREPITRITETIISISPSPPPPPFIPFSFPSFSFLPPSLFCNLGWKTSIRRRKSDRRIHHQTNANSRNLDRRCHVFFNSASKIQLQKFTSRLTET